MGNYNFTKYERDFQPGEAQISISKAGELRFSAKFCKITNIKDFEYALLFYDSLKRAIGIMPINKREKAAFKITKEEYSASISIVGFLKKYKLGVDKYRGQYDWVKENVPNIGDMYIVTLNN